MSIFLTSITACTENRERNWGIRAETIYLYLFLNSYILLPIRTVFSILVKFVPDNRKIIHFLFISLLKDVRRIHHAWQWYKMLIFCKYLFKSGEQVSKEMLIDTPK